MQRRRPKTGRPPMLQDPKRTHVILDRRQVRALDQVAKTLSTTRGALVRSAIDAALADWVELLQEPGLE